MAKALEFGFTAADKEKKVVFTLLISEVDALGFENLESDVHVVDLLQAADGRQPKPAG